MADMRLANLFIWGIKAVCLYLYLSELHLREQVSHYYSKLMRRNIVFFLHLNLHSGQHLYPFTQYICRVVFCGSTKNLAWLLNIFYHKNLERRTKCMLSQDNRWLWKEITMFPNTQCSDSLPVTQQGHHRLMERIINRWKKYIVWPIITTACVVNGCICIMSCWMGFCLLCCTV
jgi:hypothetical protein